MTTDLKNRKERQSLGNNEMITPSRRAALWNPGASLTLEAAFVLPVFMLLTAAVMYFLVIISLQNDIQIRIDETARELGKQAYIAKESDILSMAGINPLTLKAKILDDSLSERLENSGIQDGASGLKTYLSTYDSTSGILDIFVTYEYVIPYLPKKLSSFNFVHRSRTRSWIGRSLDEDSADEEDSEKETVYITPTGTVYHRSTSCSYLDLSIRQARFSEVSDLRNLSGGKYERCSSCARGAGSGTVYITNYGTNWHASLSCSGLKRTVIAIDISEAGDRRPCSKCGGTH